MFWTSVPDVLALKKKKSLLKKKVVSSECVLKFKEVTDKNTNSYHKAGIQLCHLGIWCILTDHNQKKKKKKKRYFISLSHKPEETSTYLNLRCYNQIFLHYK